MSKNKPFLAQTESTKKFARQYGISVEQFSNLDPDQKRNVLVANNSLQFGPEETIMLSFILASESADDLYPLLVGYSIEKDIDDQVIYKQFGRWLGQLIDSLNEDAFIQSRRFGRSLQKFDVSSFPLDPSDFVRFLASRSVESDGMSISDKYRADLYSKISRDGEKTLNMLDEVALQHNFMIQQRLKEK